jgi:hypothetical protein
MQNTAIEILGFLGLLDVTSLGLMLVVVLVDPRRRRTGDGQPNYFYGNCTHVSWVGNKRDRRYMYVVFLSLAFNSFILYHVSLSFSRSLTAFSGLKQFVATLCSVMTDD